MNEFMKQSKLLLCYHLVFASIWVFFTQLASLICLAELEDNRVQVKLKAANQKFGREICVFETPNASPTPSNVSRSDKFLKTRKIREAEEAAHRSRRTKAVIRVRFPDNCTLEATFHPSEAIQSIVDLLKKVITQPELPFYI